MNSVPKPLLVSLVLVAALVLRVGVAARSWLTPEAGVAAPAAGSAGQQEQASVDLPALQALDLFGAGASTQTSAQPLALPGQTNLSLQLEGIVLASPPEDSLAVIVSGGQQQSYRAGAALPGNGAVRLDSIHADHAVIDNNGRQETLWLYQGRTTSGGAGAPSQSVAGNAAASAALMDLGSSDPAVRQAAAVTLAEVIQVAPAVENGALIGYRLNPGAKLKEFVQYGFRTNDVVTAVNGIPLNDMSNLPQLYSLMNGAPEVSFSLLREGEPVTLRLAPGN